MRIISRTLPTSHHTSYSHTTYNSTLKLSKRKSPKGLKHDVIRSFWESKKYMLQNLQFNSTICFSLRKNLRESLFVQSPNWSYLEVLQPILPVSALTHPSTIAIARLFSRSFIVDITPWLRYCSDVRPVLQTWPSCVPDFETWYF